MKEKEQFPLAKIADDLGKPLFVTAVLPMAAMLGSLVLAIVYHDLAFANYGIMLGLIGAIIALLIVTASYLLIWIEIWRTPTETPDRNQSGRGRRPVSK